MEMIGRNSTFEARFEEDIPRYDPKRGFHGHGSLMRLLAALVGIRPVHYVKKEP